MSSLDEFCASKSQWRDRLLQQRRALDERSREADDQRLHTGLRSWLGERGVNAIAAYVPVGGEPGGELPEMLRAAGLRVLLPVVVDRSSPLEWAEYTGPDSLRPATYGLLEPAGQRLGAAAIAQADAVLVPALGVDRSGVRLGRGAGHYDRSLPLADPGAERIAVVRDVELVAELPGEPHDVRMTGVITPGGGVARLPV
ncbi:5-formyltetrahydrofolate cyclo-ligase [Saccharopolyspora griseoalba]|uniref:5-formyltetrahydrofolate cyclo-ligase n=1 Tax=Saccharopolyspora griseoalba TaxID=1431848 RepID=A0ABW2LHS2_9PSEU